MKTPQQLVKEWADADTSKWDSDQLESFADDCVRALAALAAPVPATFEKCEACGERLYHWNIDAAPAPAPKWIPVGERLPDIGDYVLVYMPAFPQDRPIAKIVTFDARREWVDLQEEPMKGAEFTVTHWMPLHPPPAAAE